MELFGAGSASAFIPHLAPGLLQFGPAALMLVVLGCARKSFITRPIARARSLLPDHLTARLAVEAK